jgi:hypothetical protein
MVVPMMDKEGLMQLVMTIEIFKEIAYTGVDT